MIVRRNYKFDFISVLYHIENSNRDITKELNKDGSFLKELIAKDRKNIPFGHLT